MGAGRAAGGEQGMDLARQPLPGVARKVEVVQGERDRLTPRASSSRRVVAAMVLLPEPWAPLRPMIAVRRRTWRSRWARAASGSQTTSTVRRKLSGKPLGGHEIVEPGVDG